METIPSAHPLLPIQFPVTTSSFLLHYILSFLLNLNVLPPRLTRQNLRPHFSLLLLFPSFLLLFENYNRTLCGFLSQFTHDLHPSCCCCRGSGEREERIKVILFFVLLFPLSSSLIWKTHVVWLSSIVCCSPFHCLSLFPTASFCSPFLASFQTIFGCIKPCVPWFTT